MHVSGANIKLGPFDELASRGAETPDNPLNSVAEPRRVTRAGRGLNNGFACGVFGGACCAAAGALAFGVSLLLTLPNESDSLFGLLLAASLAVLAAVLGAVIGGLLGGVAGLILGAAKAESIAPFVAGLLSGALAIVTIETDRRISEIAAAGIGPTTAVFAAIGFAAGLVFRNLMRKGNDAPAAGAPAV